MSCIVFSQVFYIRFSKVPEIFIKSAATYVVVITLDDVVTLINIWNLCLYISLCIHTKS